MAERTNRLRTEMPETKNELKNASKERNPSGRFSFLNNNRLIKLTGGFLLAFSLFLFGSFVSFLFTWSNDQSVVGNPDSSWLIIFDAENNKVENWFGILGALVSQQFIQNWFGIASFTFIFIFFLIGYRLFFKVALLNLLTSLGYSFFVLVFISIFFGFWLNVFDSGMYYLGGVFGLQVSAWLMNTLGALGTGLLLCLLGLSFAIIAFNLDFSLAKPPVEELDEEGIDVPEPVLKNAVLIENSEGSTPIVLPINEGDILTEEEISEELPEVPLEPVTDIPVEIVTQPEMLSEDTNEDEKAAAKLVKELGQYDPTLDLSSYKYPTLDLLENYGNSKITINEEELKANKDRIVNTLRQYNIDISHIKATVGPTVTLYEIVPAAGVRISKIKNLEDDIALSLAALGIRIIAPMPGKGTIGIEVPNQNPNTVAMRSVLADEKFQSSTMDLPIALGKTISNEVFVADLAKMPHLLMAGATGQGKSVGINALLVSLLYKKHPSQLKFVMVDPKKVELTLFKKIERHFLAKLPGDGDAIITDTKKVIHTLNSLCIEMDQRYDLLKDAHVRNLKEYNVKFVGRRLNPENGHRYLPYIVLVIDEFADLMMTAGKEIETPIARLAQLARAIGIHLVIATQRPSVNVITGTIKANFPGRLAFRVSSKIDSRTILDTGGADQLIGKGDMLLSTGNDVIRLQCAFVDTHEVEKITEFIGSQRGYSSAHILPEYIDENGEGASKDFDPDERDPLFEDAARLIVMHQQGSTSLIQRKLKLGYNRAGRIIDQLESAGIVGPFTGSKARVVLIIDEYGLEQFLSNMNDKKNA